MQKNCRTCRKFQEKLFLKGERCLQPKCALTRRETPPGVSPQAAKSRRKKKSEYGLQLQEKQKIKMEYGMREAQFHRFFVKAASQKGATGEMMLQMLERRLDNVIYRLTWAPSRAAARQLISHNHIKLNGKKSNIPSMLVNQKDKIEPIDKASVEGNIDLKAKLPSWLKFDPKSFAAEVVNLPVRADIDLPVDEQLIVEFYSK